MHRCNAGGGFGVRGELYPDDILVAYLARLLGRPVKWTEYRAEHMGAVNHSRDQAHRIAGAFDSGGRLLAIRDEIWHDNGALACYLTLLPAGFLLRLVSLDGLAHVVAGGRAAVLR